MLNLYRISTICFLIASVVADKKVQKPTRSVVITAEEEKLRDVAGYAAIGEIHREMDDDHSGSIDRAESTGFMTEDMNMRGSDARRREKAFHREDDAITIDDLWEAWFESEERVWTNEQVIDWITNVVNLPQYAGVLSSLKIDGRHLPRLAVHNSSFMTSTLNIKSSVHRQKLRLNALDVVLFGYRDSSSRFKDIALALLVLLLTSTGYLFWRHKRRALSEQQQLREKLDELKTLESDWLQQQKNNDRMKRSTADGGASRAEMEHLREQLEEAHKRLGNMEINSSATPLALQPLLRKTCEIELAVSEAEKQMCVEEMKLAMEEINNVARRQGSLLNSLKLATGGNTGADKVDSQIYFIKQRMERVQASTREMQERWQQIEDLCGFSILYASEIGMARNPIHTSGSSQFYRSESSTGSSKSLTSAAVIGTKPSTNRPQNSTLTGVSLHSPSTQPISNFYVHPKDDHAEMYMSTSTLPDSVSMAGGSTTTSTTFSPQKEKKKKLFGSR
ncbi:unnamed protein product, partial [Mesorhabditis belari]|uniref:SAM domain-containing protein n=1 Tax=Mesorhabditis belari TaxID=2138241 RepID=A0AAF3EAF6_9BILA